MSRELDIDNLTNREINSAKKVLNVEKSNREGETLSEAFVKRIEETMEIGETGYKRDILFPIPLELIEESKEAAKFVQRVGQISKDKSINLPVELEDEEVGGVIIFNMVLSPTKDTNIKKIREILNV